MSTQSEITALITLFLDPDPEVHLPVRDRLWEIGDGVIPHLDECRVKTADGPERKRLEDLILDLAFHDIEGEFSLILSSGLTDLLEVERAVLQICRIEDPTLRTEQVIRKLDAMALSISESMKKESVEGKKPTLSTTEGGTTRYFLKEVFNEFGFQGDTENYFHPSNAFLHTVLDRRRGMPLTIALVTLFLARRLDIELYGVNMPIHFLLMFSEEGKRRYVDPFDQGEYLTINQCAVFLKRNGIILRPEHLAPASPADILLRLLRNLSNASDRIGDDVRSISLNHLLLRTEDVLRGAFNRVHEGPDDPEK